MKPCLVDTNVWLALLVPKHEHHRLAHQWFERLAANEAGLCRIVQVGVIRLMGNRAVMREEAISAIDAWGVIELLLQDERVTFLNELPGLDSVFPTLLKYQTPTRKLVADAYLAAFAINESRRLVSLDRGFRQFRGLDLELLTT